ncbi:MAG: hypothetical protein JNJ61_07715 [Anaerolineae bacterium]|nr:hypothetical protein [Anaerolineae bacterium]
MNIRKWTLTLLLAVLLVVGMVALPAAADDEDCPLGQGYWKNTAAWPVTELTLGGQTYNQAELLIILNTPPEGDASLILAHQLIAAKLNIADGDDDTVIGGVITQADTLLGAYPGKLPYNIAPSATDGQSLVNLATVTDSYNNGLLTPDCELTPTPTMTPTVSPTSTPEGTPEATPEGTPEATPEATPEGTPEATPEATPDDDDDTIIIVIEGPVEEININIIVIYGIEIELDVDDPLLLIIKIGDIVRIEGSVSDDDDDDDDSKIIIIAITVIIINVDINIETGEVWRDDGDCSNGPPPWAPANGWRRRCEGNGGGNPGNGNGNGNGRGNDDDDDDD